MVQYELLFIDSPFLEGLWINIALAGLLTLLAFTLVFPYIYGNIQ